MLHPSDEIPLSIVITVVSGAVALRRCLASLAPQVDAVRGEIIVPYDEWSSAVAELRLEFPAVRFHHLAPLGSAAPPRGSAHAHRLYDRRRAVGLALARGRIVAMTEDHAVPAADWCRQTLAAHEQPYAVIGGAIDNAVDAPINWALYYCDFGRYGRPLPAAPAAYVSDVNVAYKRVALAAMQPLWREAYSETTLHWALRARGERLFLDPRMVVQQHRPRIGLAPAYRERIRWGRAFAETRAAANPGWRTACYAAGTPLLPPLLALRALRNMLRQRRTFRQIVATLPLVALLATGWSLGELLGYTLAPPLTLAMSGARAARQVDPC